MYFNWKKLLQSLPILGILFVSGTKQASAVGWSSIPILGDFWSFLGGALDNVAEGIVQGLVGVLGFIIQALGTLWINVANMVIAYGFGLNSTLGQSSIIQDGFEISLAIVNIAFVLGLVIIAIVTMIRADWLVDTKKAIPRFIAAVLLINFSFFIGINLIINPVDSITRNIYTASQFDGNSFSHVFIPSIDLEPSIKSQAIIAQVASGEAKDNGTGVSITIDEYKKYIEFKSDLGASIKEELFRAEGAANLDVTSSERLEALRKLDDRIDIWILDPIDQTNLVANLAGGVAGRAAISAIPGLGVVGTVVGTVTGFASMFSTIKASWNDILVDEWDRGDLINAFDEVLDRIEVYKLRPENTSVNIADIFNEKVANYYRGDLANPSAACSINNKASQDTDACRALMAMAAVDNQELPLVTRISIALAQVLFKATFVFLGGFGLLAVGVMFIIRYIALSFLIILFPFAWIGWIFPKLSAGGKNIWTAWWSQFIRWVFFGPVSMFFFFLAVRGAIHIDDVVDPGKGLQDVLGGGSMGGIGEAFGNMIVVLGLLIGGVYAANKMGIMGSGYFMSAMKKTGSWAKNKIKDYSTKPIKYAGKKAKDYTVEKGGRGLSNVLADIPGFRATAGRAAQKSSAAESARMEEVQKQVSAMNTDALLAMAQDPSFQRASDTRQSAVLSELSKRKRARAADVGGEENLTAYLAAAARVRETTDGREKFTEEIVKANPAYAIRLNDDTWAAGKQLGYLGGALKDLDDDKLVGLINATHVDAATGATISTVSTYSDLERRALFEQAAGRKGVLGRINDSVLNDPGSGLKISTTRTRGQQRISTPVANKIISTDPRLAAAMHADPEIDYQHDNTRAAASHITPEESLNIAPEVLRIHDGHGNLEAQNLEALIGLQNGALAKMGSEGSVDQMNSVRDSIDWLYNHAPAAVLNGLTTDQQAEIHRITGFMIGNPNWQI